MRKEKVCKEAYKVWMKREDVKTLIDTPPTWEAFLKKPVIRVDSFASVPWQNQIEHGEKFPTSSGKIEFYNSLFETWDPSKTDSDWGGTGVGGPMLPMVMYEVPEEGFINAKCKDYPLETTQPHNRYHGGFQSTNPYLKGDLYRHSVWISVVDAKARGIKDNDLVRVYNNTGEMVIPAYVTSRITPGTVNIYFSQKYVSSTARIDSGGNPNILNRGERNSYAQGPRNDLVDVEKF